MNWDLLDFAVFGGMVLTVGVIYALARRRSGDRAYRYAAGIALASAFILVWVNGAVGIIGSENNDANLMFFGVLGVGIIGAIITRFQANGMAKSLVATAIAQVIVAAIALAANLGASAPMWPKDIIFMTLFFVALWLLSAWFFKNAISRDSAQSGI